MGPGVGLVLLQETLQSSPDIEAAGALTWDLQPPEVQEVGICR